MLDLTSRLFNTLGYIIAIAFLFTKFKSTKKIFSEDRYTKKEILILCIFFSGLSILGTYIGVNYKGAIANTRNIGVVVGGILIGPKVAIITGLIAGIHRFFVDLDGVTAIPCAISTILGGIITGIVYRKSNVNNRYFLGFICGVIIESLSMILILMFSENFELAKEIVQDIYIPMLLINAFGVSIVIIIIEGILEEKERIAGTQAKLALEIANKTLPYFRKGECLGDVCGIILESLNAQAVVITDRKEIIAYRKNSGDFEIYDSQIQSEATKKVLITGEVLTSDRNGDIIDFSHHNMKIKSCIISPLFEGEKVSGTLKIYFDKDKSITARNRYLAIGLSQLISTQLEISKMENLKMMARDAELKALQTQINPHFLFNALHATASFVRINPAKARNIIIDLSTYLRYNLDNPSRFVTLDKELEQVKAYVNIEQARFQDKIKVNYNIDQEVNEIKIPSLIIQPLVENSIKHGILKQREQGIINIDAIKYDKGCIISIEDNGVGIKKEIINSIDQEIDKSIGLKNVHNRIKLIYGEGLKIEQLEKGTKISFYVE
ncbi:MAG: sensor histidine kinase [Cetobacterium sp.]|uniref:sensor histidine kinase n=1 Tax=unclassified Cetobacterium TaxID=2630983 RepID=UPI00163C7C46|nr:sensor histidine kinase [Cetobacterium sp. 2A]MBC2856789.1 sensor histidine kinase [Cetobacterium sp. 2A]